MIINMIVKFAMNRAGYIGKDGGLPWKCREDMKDFREKTTGNVVMMGRKTWESIGHALPNRDNVVVSNDREWVTEMNDKYKSQDNLIFVKGLLDAIRTAKIMSGKYDSDVCKVYVIGGAKLIDSMLEQYGAFVDKIEVSLIDDITEGDCKVNQDLLTRFMGITEYRGYSCDQD